MTLAVALSRLKILAQVNVHPVLGSDELELCLELAKVNVKVGVDDFDLNRAAHEAWLLKAGKSSDHHMMHLDGRRFMAKEVHDNCMAMAEKYRKRITGTYEIVSR